MAGERTGAKDRFGFDLYEGDDVLSFNLMADGEDPRAILAGKASKLGVAARVVRVDDHWYIRRASEQIGGTGIQQGINLDVVKIPRTEQVQMLAFPGERLQVSVDHCEYDAFLSVSIADEHGDFRRFLTEAELEPLCKRIEEMLNG